MRLLKKEHIDNFNIQNYVYDEANFSKDDFCFNYIYLKSLNDNSMNSKNVFLGNEDAYGQILYKKIFYLFRVKKTNCLKPIYNPTFNKEKYSAQEAENLYNNYFINNSLRNQENRLSFTKFKLFLKILRNQFTDFIFQKSFYPKSLAAAKITERGWRVDLINTVINSLIEFLNSNVSILEA